MSCIVITVVHRVHGRVHLRVVAHGHGGKARSLRLMGALCLAETAFHEARPQRQPSSLQQRKEFSKAETTHAEQ